MKATRDREAQAAWLNAQYAVIAYHDPAKMPERPGAVKKPKTQSAIEADLITARATLIAMANRSTANG